MTLLQTIDRYAAECLHQYGHRFRDEHRHALSAMRHCRTKHYGQLHWQCPGCEHTQDTFRSCGHRSCQRCQNPDNTRWLERQQRKLLPVDYFMVTFTLPAQCRGVAWENQRAMYGLLFDAAVSTCRDFARTDKHLRGEIGQSAVLHTQTRKLDYGRGHRHETPAMANTQGPVSVRTQGASQGVSSAHARGDEKGGADARASPAQTLGGGLSGHRQWPAGIEVSVALSLPWGDQ